MQPFLAPEQRQWRDAGTWPCRSAQVQQPRPAGLALWAGRARHRKVEWLSGPACTCHVPLHWRRQRPLGQQGQSRRALPLARLTPVPALTLTWDSGSSRSRALFCLGPISQPARDLSKVSVRERPGLCRDLNPRPCAIKISRSGPSPRPQACKPSPPLLSNNAIEISGHTGMENQQWGVRICRLPHPVSRSPVAVWPILPVPPEPVRGDSTSPSGVHGPGWE